MHSSPLGDPNLVLPRVYWIGGSACAGKTTITKRLAARHGLVAYHCDERFDDHLRRADPERHRRFLRLARRPPEDLWRGSVDEQTRDLHGFYEDEFELVVDDLRALSAGGPVLAEGAGLLPARVGARQALWLVTTPELRRRRHRTRRPWAEELVAGRRDPGAAHRRWMERDDRFAELIVSQARRAGAAVLVDDGRLSLEEIVAEVARRLGLARAA